MFEPVKVEVSKVSTNYTTNIEQHYSFNYQVLEAYKKRNFKLTGFLIKIQNVYFIIL